MLALVEAKPACLSPREGCLLGLSAHSYTLFSVLLPQCCCPLCKEKTFPLAQSWHYCIGWVVKQLLLGFFVQQK